MVYAGREAEDELEVYREEKKQYRVLAQQAREKMQMLMSLISELVVGLLHDISSTNIIRHCTVLTH